MSRKIVTESKKLPIMTVIHGPEGIGKSTFVAGCPGVILLPTEPSSDRIGNVAKFERAGIQKWEDVAECVQECFALDYKALAIDTIDHAHQMAREYIIRTQKGEKGAAFTESSYDSYGRGDKLAGQVCWRPLLKQFERLVNEKGMDIILTAHSAIKDVDPPDREKYSKWAGKLPPYVWGMIKEFVDVVLFADFEISVKESEGPREKNKAFTEGLRICYTTPHPARDAKHRAGIELPETFPLGWDEYMAALSSGKDRSAALVTEILAYEMPEAKLKASLAYFKIPAWDAANLATVGESVLAEILRKFKTGNYTKKGA